MSDNKAKFCYILVWCLILKQKKYQYVLFYCHLLNLLLLVSYQSFPLEIQIRISNFEWTLDTKGGLVSICLWYLQFFEKRMKKIDFTTKVPQVELFSFIFWDNWGRQKDISKLTDLYPPHPFVIDCKSHLKNLTGKLISRTRDKSKLLSDPVRKLHHY